MPSGSSTNGRRLARDALVPALSRILRLALLAPDLIEAIGYGKGAPVADAGIMYGLGDGAKNAKPVIIHIEGDPDHPVNRGTLCPKGAALLEFVHSDTRTKYPLHRKPGTDQFERVTWDFALERIARLMKDDRDANFIARNQDGTVVNRWITTGFLAASATTNETAFLTYKVVRSTGMVVFDNQARV